jgi:integrase
VSNMSIQKRGEKWLARVSRQLDGKQKETAKRFRLKADAVRWVREQQTKIERGEWVQPTRQTLNAFLDTWLAGVQEANQRTREHYRSVLKLYVRPALGDLRLDQVSRAAVKAMIAGLTDRGLSPRTARYAHAVLRLALNSAVEDRLLIANPAIGRKLLPPLRRLEQCVLPNGAVRWLLWATRDDRLGPLWNLLARTGMRPGEALGLSWPDLDLNAATPVVRIQRTLVPQKKDATGRTWRLEDPKTATSRRVIELLPETVEALQWHRTRQEAERMVAGERYATHRFVFCTEWGEPLREDVVYKGPFRRALTAAGVPMVTLYGLRHAHCSALLAKGMPPRKVAERLGHSTPMLTLTTYAHAMPGEGDEALALL